MGVTLRQAQGRALRYNLFKRHCEECGRSNLLVFSQSEGY